MFSLEYAKFMVNKNLQNDNVNFLVENWIKKVKNILINHKPEDVKRVIHWLNDYTKKIFTFVKFKNRIIEWS